MTVKGVSCVAAVVCLVTIIFVAIRRLFFHRLAHFPGPKFAAVTSLYKVYFQVVLGGELLNHLHEMHAMYGTC